MVLLCIQQTEAATLHKYNGKGLYLKRMFRGDRIQYSSCFLFFRGFPARAVAGTKGTKTREIFPILLS